MEQVGLAAATTDVSLWSLFMQAGLVVKLVMLGLIAASVWTWAIVIDKYLAYGRARRQFDKFEQVFWSGQSLEELYRSLSERSNTGLAAIFVAAMREWKKSFERGARSPIGLQMRIDRAMDVTLARESEYLGARLGSLATIGSAGPFIGLFGTVVGIMTSFQAIAGSKSTNPRSWRPVSPKRCLRPPSASSPPFRRSSPTTSSPPTPASSRRAWKASRTNSPPSFRARSMRSCSLARRHSNRRRARPWVWLLEAMAAEAADDAVAAAEARPSFRKST
jgi:biopolymer transport protein TolQ